MNIRRLALIIPHTDTTLETDLKRELPDNWFIHTQRIWLDEVGYDAEREMVDSHLPKAIEYLRDITEFDAVIFGCTSASAVYGKKGLDRLEDLISNEMNCRGKSAFGAILNNLDRIGNKKISLMTPYTEEVNGFMVRILEEFGYQVNFSAGMGLKKDREISEVEPSEIRKLIMDNAERIKSNNSTILISCTNLRSLEVREELETIMEMPVVTSNHAIIDWLLE